jgi:signal transduction histidine kinase
VEDRPRRLLVRTGRDDDGGVRLIVQDTGAGFDAANVNRLFDAFYTTKNNGMGIGLAVSRSIIESHRGRLWAAPNDGPGATFSFSLPAASADREPDRLREDQPLPQEDACSPEAVFP